MIHLSLKNNIHDNISVMGVRFTHRPYFWGMTDSYKNEKSELFKMHHSSLQHPKSYRS